MTTKIVDIADEIYRELLNPSDLSIASISFWLRTNLGKLNILLNKTYSINTTDLEIDTISPETFTIIEKDIFKKLYKIHYYDRQIINLIGKASSLNLVSTETSGTGISSADSLEISQNGFTARRTSSTKTANETIRANTQFIRQLGLNFVELKKQESEELKDLIKSYNVNEISPLQVVGDDIIPESNRGSYSYSIRSLESL